MYCHTDEFCSGEYFEASCAQNEVIIMSSARYGRMRTGRCITYDIEIGCHAEVISVMDQFCSGKATCRHKIVDDDFVRFHNCTKELKGFLEAAYSCKPGE